MDPNDPRPAWLIAMNDLLVFLIALSVIAGFVFLVYTKG